jgi:hypothetical protein
VSAHWRLALWYVAWICVGAIPVGMGVWFLYGAVYAGVFLYGVGMGAVSFLSIAATVSMLTAPSKVWQGLGMTFFAARYGFMAAALGIPAFIGPWPLAPMLFGFAAVYVAENVVLLPGVSRVLGSTRSKRATDVRPKRKKLERRIVER